MRRKILIIIIIAVSIILSFFILIWINNNKGEDLSSLKTHPTPIQLVEGGGPDHYETVCFPQNNSTGRPELLSQNRTDLRYYLGKSETYNDDLVGLIDKLSYKFGDTINLTGIEYSHVRVGNKITFISNSNYWEGLTDARKKEILTDVAKEGFDKISKDDPDITYLNIEVLTCQDRYNHKYVGYARISIIEGVEHVEIRFDW